MKTVVHKDKAFIEETIRRCDICYLGMADTDGTPYVLPMNFGYKDGTVYLHSAQEGRSISILDHNPKVCLAFSIDHDLVFQHPEVACSYRMRSKSVIAWGKVVYEEDFDRKVEALDLLMAHYSDKTFKYSDPAIRNVKIWKIDFEEVTCKEFGAPHQK
ncbi:MAG: pyridoxamine 5'-phosphate oxidase family protein [Massilibacteroides sp.]|nr:pyridoxamine 5'-phosphate oxidase family protein [Massilibacteroides sp.]MDD3061987.1 pyridoxamine 5'-phosphate oxidase family protein [Massilibacteroides sp.]MDD4114042.1 pyridoxamine 5'-phosphate oxidase family protein [Massilibacteroides sp.]MDD4659296.1 pyridoxamine 5'-phosphate oxidase family protein [Massilibacteroides sp.]